MEVVRLLAVAPPPHLAQQRRVGEELAGVTGENAEQRELVRRELDGLAADRDGSLLELDPYALLTLRSTGVCIVQITEEAFDPNLNPIRAKVSLGMRVLNVDDLGFDHPGGRMYLTYLTNKENMAGRVANAALAGLGLGS